MEKTIGRRITDFLSTGPLRVALLFITPVAGFFALRWSVNFMRDPDANKLLVGLVALIVGIFGVWALFLLTDAIVSRLPEGWRERVRPYVFVGPSIIILTAYLIYPTINTIFLSLRAGRGDSWANAQSPFGLPLDNYLFIFSDPSMLDTLRNNIFWLVGVTGVTVSLGLVIAVMVDRIKLESLAKSIIFLPMAISAVGASVIWKFIYNFKAPGTPQNGLLNAVWVALGNNPVGWLVENKPWNNFFLIIILIWLLTGFAMVVLSAAVKGVPAELLEAARMDGATEIRIFFSVIVPHIQGSIITITTTIVIMVLKVFDIVFVMTNGQFDTQVIANRMYSEMFTYRNFGRGSAIAVLLLVAVLPIMISNIRSFNKARN
ncbi:MAG: sugar ABC transporter permease [Anaerolineales bacterium]